MPNSSAHTLSTADAPASAPGSQSGPVVELYSKDPGYVVASVGKYFLHIQRTRLNITGVSLMRRGVAEISERHDKFGYLVIIEPDADLLFPTDVRSGIDAMVKRYSNRMAGAAVVFEKQGFQATAVRSVVTAINVASRATHPTQVFSELQEGVSWLNGLTGGEPTAGRLLHIAKQLRASP
jgi:hypothetical protein